MRQKFSGIRTILCGAAFAALLVLAAPAQQAAAKSVPKLPEPYVSRALDAVVIPIDAAVRKAFKLKKKDRGVLVLAVMPKGFAARNGIKAGDVLRSISGYAIHKPVDIDAIVYYWISQNFFDFIFDVGYGGTYQVYSWPLTREEYIEVIDITTISTWESWSVETYSFSYTEFYSEYSTEITEVYQSSETMIETEVSSQTFVEEANAVAQDADKDGAPDGLEAIESEEATAPADDGTDQDSAADQGGEEQPGDDQAGDDQAGPADDGQQVDEQPVDDGGADQPVDEGVADEQPVDDGGADEPVDEPVDDGGGEEPVEE